LVAKEKYLSDIVNAQFYKMKLPLSGGHAYTGAYRV